METIKNMPDSARVWVYQTNRLLSDVDANAITIAGNHFIAGWLAHGASLKASFEVLYNRFIVISVDEQQALASGCSIDTSVKFMKELEQQFNLNLFDRLQVAYRKGNEIIVCHISEFEKLAQQGIVNESTIVFNNMVITKTAFDKEWEVPVKDSWQKKVLVTENNEVEKKLQTANALLKKNEKKLKEAQAIARLGSWEIDFTANTHVWSDEFYKIFGVDKEGVVPSAELFLSFIHPKDLEYSNKKVAEAFSSFTDSSFSFRFIRQDGSVRYGYSEYKFEFDEIRKPIRLYGIVQDITESKKSEKIILKKNKQLRALSYHLQNIREEERKHVAREIHDELGQQLTALKMDIDWILHKQQKSEIVLIDKLQEMLKMNDDIINTVRRISSDLRPAILDDLGLIATIEWKCADFEEKTGISCQFISMNKERSFNKHLSINIYRILQETLTNISRHAEARAVIVSLKVSEIELLLDITDDGKGIASESIYNNNKLGILGMKERAELLGGELLISGTTNKGTQVKLILPLENEYINS